MRKVFLLTLLGMLGTQLSSAATQLVQFVNISGQLAFQGGGQFQFTPEPSNTTEIFTNNVVGFDSSLNNKFGNISGTFQMGAANLGDCGGQCAESRAITGTGSFQLFDGANSLTATYTPQLLSRQGNSGGIDVVSTVLNIQNMTAVGSNTGFNQLAAFHNAYLSINFTVSGLTSLSQLFAGGVTSSYQGTLSVVPEPGAYAALLAPGVAGLVYLARRRKQQAEAPVEE